MAKIFISYRREDSQWPAHKLYDTIRPLVADPDSDVFIDVDNIPLGVNFSEHLDGKVAQCDYLLAVIGPHWLSVSSPETGARRLDDPGDFVRIEIASALSRGIPVIPVLMDGARLPAPLDLPEELRELPLRNGVEVRHLSFEHDVRRLIDGLGLAHQTPSETAPLAMAAGRSTQSQASGGKGPAILVGLLIAIAGIGATTYVADPFGWFASGNRVAEVVERPAEPFAELTDAETPGSAPDISSLETGRLAGKEPEADTGETADAAAASDAMARQGAVRGLQAALIDKAFLSGRADGIAGSGTRAAVRQFELESGLSLGLTDPSSAPIEAIEAATSRIAGWRRPAAQPDPEPQPEVENEEPVADAETPDRGAGTAEVEIPDAQPKLEDRDVAVISHPMPTYPTRAAERGVEGRCEVHFAVDATGSPFNIEADCTDALFKREAERAVSNARFAPKIENGVAVARAGVIYPLEFSLAN